MTHALFVGVGQLLDHILEKMGSGLRTTKVSTFEEALGLIASRPPDVVVISSAVDRGGLLPAAHRRNPRFRGSVIEVDLTNPADGLTVHEWVAARRAYMRRAASLARLVEELRGLCRRAEERSAAIESVRTLGYNDCVEVMGRILQVQTEVIGRHEMSIRTVIVEGGQVLNAISRPFPEELLELGNCDEHVHGQHLKVLAGVRDGQLC